MGGYRDITSVAVLAILLAGCASPERSGGAASTTPRDVVEATDPNDGAALLGLVVSDEHVPLAGVDVTLRGEDLRAATNLQGRFRIEGLAAGRYDLFAQKLGYESRSVAVDLLDGQETTIQVILASQPVDAAG